MKYFVEQLIFMFMLFLDLICPAKTVTDIYDFKMSLKIPRVYDNAGSLGYRKYQPQSISGYLIIQYIDNEPPTISISNLVNNTHKNQSGTKISYQCYIDEELSQNFSYIGNNKNKKFETPSINFSFIADPSYNIGEVSEDNSLYISLAGKGRSRFNRQFEIRIAASFSGYVTGQIGCGCSAYTHMSPTRVAGPSGPSGAVTDIASVYGIWSAKFRSRR